MGNDVKEYVDTCTTCHRIKAARHQPFDHLESFPFPKNPRENWTMDFITDLPRNARRGSVFDSILVIVDRYIKFTRYIPSRKDWKAA